MKFGWGAGGWLNIPLGKAFSVEPQLIYNHYVYNSESIGALLGNGSANYLSVPVLLKLDIGKNFALTAGPQFDFLMSIKDKNNNNEKSDFTGTRISGNVGLEMFPHARVTPFARYIFGFTNMDNTNNQNTQGELKNQNIQMGVKFKLFGTFVPGDKDGDGVIDKDDKCPDVVGLARYQGCPIPDTDGDGINDEEDKCPTIAGPAENGGCPKINFNASAVQFVSGSCTLTTGAKTELNKLVKILNEAYPDVKIAIEGHTDNTGKAEKNKSLSECRANAVKSYLVSKKVAGERLSAAGFGQEKPIADNATKEGKAQNRRVEFHVSQ